MSSDTNETKSESGSQGKAGGSGPMALLLPLVLLAGLGFLGWKVFLSDSDNNSDSADSSSTAVDGPADSTTSTSVRQTFVGVAAAIADVTDEASAKTAADKVNEMASKVESLNLDALKGARRVYIKPVVTTIRKSLKSTLEETYKIPGVKSVLEPAIKAYLDKLTPIDG